MTILGWHDERIEFFDLTGHCKPISLCGLDLLINVDRVVGFPRR